MFAVEYESYDDPASFYLMDRSVDPPVVRLFVDPLDASEWAATFQREHPECVAKAVPYVDRIKPAAPWTTRPTPGLWWVRFVDASDGATLPAIQCAIERVADVDDVLWATTTTLVGTHPSACNYFVHDLTDDGAQFAPWIEGQEAPP
jgi:hypothetical protein